MKPAASSPRNLKLIRVFILFNILGWGNTLTLPVGNLGLNMLVTLLIGALVGGKAAYSCYKSKLFTRLIVFYGALAFLLGPVAEGGSKVASSCLLYLACIWAVGRIADRVEPEWKLLSVKAIIRLFCIILILPFGEFVLESLNLMPVYRIGGYRETFFFLEPSHLSMTMTPLFIFGWLTGTAKEKFQLTVLQVVVFALFPVSTTIASILFSLLFVYFATLKNLKQMVLFVFRLGTLLVIGLVFIQLPIAEHTLDRVIGTFSELSMESNLSSIVYINGWQSMTSYLDTSHGLGLGFNAMGFEPRAVTLAYRLLEIMSLQELNASDGSFALSKLGSEFGFLGIGIWLYSLVLAFKLVRSGLGSSQARSPSKVLLFTFLSYLAIGGVIRSTGYFSGPLLLALFSVFTSTGVPASREDSCANLSSQGPQRVLEQSNHQVE